MVVWLLTFPETTGWFENTLVFVALFVAVITAVHHAEVIAVRVGEPFGTLVLALAITVIELGLIGSVMLSGSEVGSTLARDTLFATVMIVVNGVVGLCLVAGALRHHVMVFRSEGAGHALSVLAPLTVLTMILPTFTTATQGPTYSDIQLAFVGLCSLVLYGIYLFVQAVRHRDYFLPLEDVVGSAHVAPPSTRQVQLSVALLLVALGSVVGLAKTLAPAIEATVAAVSAPVTIVGIVFALLVLLPETLAALRAALRNRMQTSLNLALGSALATICLTIPGVALLSVLFGLPLELGLPNTQKALLILTLLVATLTLTGGRSTVLHRAVHLVLFFAFLVLSFVL